MKTLSRPACWLNILRRSFCVAALGFITMTKSEACPLCKTGTGQQVREQIFNADFGKNLARTLAPFPVLIALIALVQHISPKHRQWAESRRKEPYE